MDTDMAALIRESHYDAGTREQFTALKAEGKCDAFESGAHIDYYDRKDHLDDPDP
eukprot:gene53127-62313_t